MQAKNVDFHSALLKHNDLLVVGKVEINKARDNHGIHHEQIQKIEILQLKSSSGKVNKKYNCLMFGL